MSVSVIIISIVRARLNAPWLPSLPSSHQPKRPQNNRANTITAVSTKILEDVVLNVFEHLLDDLERVKVSHYAHKVGEDNGKSKGNISLQLQSRRREPGCLHTHFVLPP